MSDNRKVREAYLFIYDEFAADTTEVAEHIGLSVKDTYKLLEPCSLLESQLSVDGTSGRGITRKRFPGVPYTWQCYETYDYIDREEAIALFDKTYPAPADKDS